MKSIRCLRGVHRWACHDTFSAHNMIYGLECVRCGTRRLTIGGARPAAPPMPLTAEDAANLAIMRMARRWAAERTGELPAAVKIWWR